MNERQKRLKEVYEHLRQHRGIHTKTDFANAIRYGRTSLSAAMNGNESYLTDSLFRNICEAFPGMFNVEYLLNGTGDLLTPEESIANEEAEKRYLGEKIVEKIGTTAAYRVIDQSSMVNAIIATYEGRIADLKETVADLRSSLKQKDDHIADLRATIDELRARVASLQTELQNINRTDLDYPFPVGAADHPKHPKNV